MKWKTRWI